MSKDTNKHSAQTDAVVASGSQSAQAATGAPDRAENSQERKRTRRSARQAQAVMKVDRSLAIGGQFFIYGALHDGICTRSQTQKREGYVSSRTRSKRAIKDTTDNQQRGLDRESAEDVKQIPKKARRSAEREGPAMRAAHSPAARRTADTPQATTRQKRRGQIQQPSNVLTRAMARAMAQNEGNDEVAQDMNVLVAAEAPENDHQQLLPAAVVPGLEPEAPEDEMDGDALPVAGAHDGALVVAVNGQGGMHQQMGQLLVNAGPNVNGALQLHQAGDENGQEFPEDEEAEAEPMEDEEDDDDQSTDDMDEPVHQQHHEDAEDINLAEVQLNPWNFIFDEQQGIIGGGADHPIGPPAAPGRRRRLRARRVFQVGHLPNLPEGASQFAGLNNAAKGRILDVMRSTGPGGGRRARLYGDLFYQALCNGQPFEEQVEIELVLVTRSVNANANNCPAVVQSREKMAQMGPRVKKGFLLNRCVFITGAKKAVIKRLMEVLPNLRKVCLDVSEGHDCELLRGVENGLRSRRALLQHGLPAVKFRGASKSLFLLADFMYQNKDALEQLTADVTEWNHGVLAAPRNCDEFWCALARSVRLSHLDVEADQFCGASAHYQSIIRHLKMLKTVRNLSIDPIPIQGSNLATVLSNNRVLDHLSVTLAHNNIRIGPTQVATELDELRIHLVPLLRSTARSMRLPLNCRLIIRLFKMQPELRTVQALAVGEEDYLIGLSNFMNWPWGRNFHAELNLACVRPGDVHEYASRYIHNFATTVLTQQMVEEGMMVYRLDCSRVHNGHTIRVVSSLHPMAEEDYRMLVVLQNATVV